MPGELVFLNQMIRAIAKVPLKDHYGKKTVELIEPAHATYRVTIFGLPDNCVVIKADRFTSPDSIFEGSNGQCKRCDFVIAANSGGRKVILYLEMKGERGPRAEIIQQLKGAKCFVA
jgi:hypothetical protein